LRQHFENEHTDFNKKYSGEFRKQEIASLVQTWKGQQNIFKKCDSSEQALEVSFFCSLFELSSH
jgi:hypothetical protein